MFPFASCCCAEGGEAEPELALACAGLWPECPHSQRLSQLCPPVVPNLARKRTDLIKAIMEVALQNSLP